MTRRFQFLLGLMLTVALMLGTMATTSAAGSRAAPRLSAPNVPASGPQSVSAPSGSVNRAAGRANLQADLAALDRQTANSPYRLGVPKGKLPAAVKAAVALRESLSPAQQRQLRVAFAKFSSRLERIAGPASPSGATRGKAPQNVRRQAARLAQLNGSLDRAVSKILTRKQLANNRAALRPALDKLTASSQAAAIGQRSAAVQPTTLGSYCYYGAYYELLANWWKYWGYYYSYYNYVTYGGTYAYYGYYYAYYGYLYGNYAAQLIPQTYFEYLASGYDWKGIGSTGVSYAYYDYYYAYYAYIYNYYSYYYEGGHSYAYYGYYYDYYGQYYGYYGYYYSYYYCQ
jgi:hypothetical protein